MDKAELLARILQAERPRPDDDLLPDQAHRARRSPTTWPSAASPPPPCTATSARARASRRCARSAPARSTCWSPPTSPPAASTSRASRTSINYQCPEDEKTYLHRDRPHRPGPGKPASRSRFVDWDDLPRWKLIYEALGLPFHEPAGDVLHLGAPLPGARHPRTAPGRLPRAEPHPRRPGRRGGRGPRRDRRARRASRRRRPARGVRARRPPRGGRPAVAAGAVQPAQHERLRLVVRAVGGHGFVQGARGNRAPDASGRDGAADRPGNRDAPVTSAGPAAAATGAGPRRPSRAGAGAAPRVPASRARPSRPAPAADGLSGYFRTTTVVPTVAQP